MRWTFIDPPDPESLRLRRVALEGIDRWWAAFAAHCDAIDAQFTKGEAFDIPGFFAEHLDPIQPGLMWEFGRALAKPGHRLVITPESRKELRPLVRTLLERAPALPRWEFYANRLPEPDMVGPMIEARTGSPAGEIMGRVTQGTNHRLDLLFCFPALQDPKIQAHAAFVAAETLLGEEALDTWVGVIDSTDAPGAADWLGIPELAREAEAVKQGILDSLSADPCHALHEDATWTLFKLKAKEAPDYPGQTDLFVAKTMLVDMWRTAHEGAPFYSSRFSRVGETFCYLKLDGTDGLDSERFADKSEIEDALNAALVPEGLGCYVGGGTGQRYSYIDLALTDVPRAIEVIKRLLREGNVPARTWLLFFDDELKAEWVGIWDHTPPP